VAAFRATLEETVNADLLLHVVDINHPMRELQISEVNKVLAEIGAEHIPQLMVFNKIDQKSLPAEVQRDEYDKIQSVKLSAIHGDGLEMLRAALIEAMSQSQKEQ
jgi:GTP-binding protein HflX